MVQVYSGDNRCGVMPGGEYDYPLYVIFSAEGDILDASGDKDISEHLSPPGHGDHGDDAGTNANDIIPHAATDADDAKTQVTATYRLKTEWDAVELQKDGDISRIEAARKDIILWPSRYEPWNWKANET